MPTPQDLNDDQIEALSTKDHVEHYNDLAEVLKLDVVRRFADRATGLKRTKKLAEQYRAKAPKRTASPMPTLATLNGTPQPARTKAEPKSGVRNVRRGTNLIPLGHEPMPCREGSKQAILLDMLRRERGATMPELIEALSGGNKPWTEVTVRSGFGWDLKNKGYGVRSTFDADGTERFFLVLPEKFPKIPPHTPLKSVKPKAHAAQQRLVA